MTSILLKFCKPRGFKATFICDLLLGGSQPIAQVRPGCMTSIPKNFLRIFGAVSCHLETWPNFNKQITNSTHNNFLSSSNTCVELIPSFQSDLPLCVYIKIQPWNTGLSVIRHGPSPDLYILQTPKSFQGITFHTKSSTSKLAVETPHVCKISCTQMIYPHLNYIIYYS